MSHFWIEPQVAASGTAVFVTHAFSFFTLGGCYDVLYDAAGLPTLYFIILFLFLFTNQLNDVAGAVRQISNVSNIKIYSNIVTIYQKFPSLH